MSQTIDSPLKLISDSFNGKDRLLKLAEGNNAKGRKKGSKLSLISSRSAEKEANYDLAFTSNIEHLANKDFSQRSSTPIETSISSDHDQLNTSLSHDNHSNLSCDSACECIAHSTSLNLGTISPSDLKFSDLKIGEANSFTSGSSYGGGSAFKSRIPQSVDRKRLKEYSRMQSLNRWPDTEDLSKQNSSRSSSSQMGLSSGFIQSPVPGTTKSSSTNDSHYRLTTSNQSQSHIPIYKHNAFYQLPLFDNNSNHSQFTSMLHNSSREKRFLRTNSFISYLSDNNRKYTQSIGNHALKFSSSRSSNWNEIRATHGRLPQTQTSHAICSQAPHNVQANINRQEEQSQQHLNQMVKSHSHSGLQGQNSKELLNAQLATRFLPPPILHNPPDYFGTDFGEPSSSVPTETLTDLSKCSGKPGRSGVPRVINRLDSFFVMDEDSFANSPKRIVNQPSESQESKPSLLISTPDHVQYEKYFLRESQKNALSTINSTSELTDKFVKSSSCDSLDYFRFQTLIKPKSETDLSDHKSELTGIMHLEEGVNEEESMFNRFRKSFSLRFSKHWSSGSKEIGSPLNLKDNSLTSDPNLIISEEESQLSQCASDINQNRIYRNKHVESDITIGKMSTIERRKSRADMFNRKSFRRSTRKNLRLKRSHSQPQDKSNDEISPQIDHSVDSDFEGNKSPISQTDTKSGSELNDSHENNDEIIFAEAIWDYFSSDNEELSFSAGDLIDVTDTSHKEWWWGAIKSTEETRYGWFPASYVRLKVSQEETLEEALQSTNEDPESTPKKRMSMSKMSSEQVRANVVLEIINTERDFVKNLKDVIDGYLKPCRDRVDMFDETRISTIFGNIEELYSFQSSFLRELEQSVNWDSLSSSQIGNCFLNNENGFSVYCEFCTNHPLATSELQDLFSNHRFCVFFEGCRLLKNMIDISLDGFLLTPIQKICKYPLQLGELLKYTRPEHPDYEPVSGAYMCMQRVAQMVNERKRRFESLEQLITLQESLENWEGPPLIDSCSLLMHSGEVTRITSSSWSKDVTLLLFDRLLVLCKKDTGLLKKGTYIFKSRIEMEDVDLVISLEDNAKDIHFNVITKNAFKFFYKRKQKWYLFQAKSASEKEKWIQSFAEERKRVREDEKQGFHVSERDKKGAFIAHQNNLKPKKPRARRPYSKAKKPDTVIAEIPLGPVNGFEIDRTRAGSLPSYIFQEKQSLNQLYKHRQSTMHKKSRSNWFQLGSGSVLGSNKKKSRLKRNLK